MSTWGEASLVIDEITKEIDEKAGAAGLPPANMQTFTAASGNAKAKLYITEPADTEVDSQLLCTVAGVKIMRKTGGYPTGPNDGALVLDIDRADFGTYSSTPYEDTGLTNDTLYYYAAFPYSDHGVYNLSSANRATVTPKSYTIYGYKKAKSDSNPATRITYTDAATGFTPLTRNFSADTTDLGSWANSFIINAFRPVMLKYDGTVDYELDPEDQTKKKDGTSSDISNTSYGGNAMVGVKTLWFYRYEDADFEYVKIADMQVDANYKAYAHTASDGSTILEEVFLPMFEGSSVSSKVRSLAGQTPMNAQTGATEKTQIEANGSGWQFDDWANREMIRDVLTLLGRSTNVQAVYGAGHTTGGSSASSLLQTGTKKSKGMFSCSNNNDAVKVLWLENYWGDRWDRYYGMIYDSANVIKVKMHPPYNTDGTGYTNTGVSITGTNGGYISATKMTEYGMLPKTVSGSETTYEADGCWWNTSQTNFLFCGGYCYDGAHCGFAVNVHDLFSNSNWAFGPALSYKQPAAA